MGHGGLYPEGAAAEKEAEHPQKCTGGKLLRPFTQECHADHKESE